MICVMNGAWFPKKIARSPFVFFHPAARGLERASATTLDGGVEAICIQQSSMCCVWN